MIIFVVSLTVLMVASILVSASLKLKSPIVYILSLFLIWFSIIVLAGLIANIFNLLNSRLFFLFIEVFFLLCAYLNWILKEKPSLLGSWIIYFRQISKDKISKHHKTWKYLWIFGGCILFFYLLSFILILLIPQNTNDSLTTHLARIGFWLQHGNLLPWPTPNRLSLIYPVDANIVMLWLMLFSKNPNSSGFVQWISAFVGAVAIFGLGRILHWGRAPSAFAGFIWLSLPTVLLQSTTSQLDLISAVMVTVSVYLFSYGFINNSLSEIFLSGLAFGLGLGVKQITIFAIPGFAVLIILFFFFITASFKKWFFRWLLAFFLSAIILGSFIYVQNFLYFKNLFGEGVTISEEIGNDNISNVFEKINHNLLRYTYQAIDFSEMPPIIVDNLNNLKTDFFISILTPIGIDIQSSVGINNPKFHFTTDAISPIHEDTTWYGILGLLMIFPISMIQCIKGCQQKDPLRIGLFIISVTFSLLIIIFRPGWTPNQGRYFLIPITLSAPYIAWVIRPGRKWAVIQIFLLITSLVTMAFTIINNSGKPLISYKRVQKIVMAGCEIIKENDCLEKAVYSQYLFPIERDIWEKDYIGKQIFQSEMANLPTRLVTDYVPENGNLATLVQSDLPVFPLFGDHFTRKLFPVYPPETLLDKSWFQNNKIDFLLLYLSDPQMPNPPSWLIPYRTQGNWALYYPEWNKPATP